MNAPEPCHLCDGEGFLTRYTGFRPEVDPCPRCKGTQIEPQGLPPVTTTLSPPETR